MYFANKATPTCFIDSKCHANELKSHTLGKSIGQQRSAMNQQAIAACNTISEKMQSSIAHTVA